MKYLTYQLSTLLGRCSLGVVTYKKYRCTLHSHVTENVIFIFPMMYKKVGIPQIKEKRSLAKKYQVRPDLVTLIFLIERN